MLEHIFCYAFKTAKKSFFTISRNTIPTKISTYMYVFTVWVLSRLIRALEGV